MTAKPSTFAPIEPWQSTDGDTWTRRYMCPKGGGGYVRQATVDANRRAVTVQAYIRARKPRRAIVCQFKGDLTLADIVAVQPIKLARRPWLINQKAKGVAK